MKVETQVRDIQRSSSFEEKTMGLAVGSEAFVFNVLRKDLYSDPIGSLIREYTVNAQDEHRKHGKTDVPILINVPNQFTPELHIRDFAGGLTEEQVFNFFGNYGASDKRDSNVAVGFFGLGCKSAFAYTDSYIVKSFKDGMEYTFNIYIDETEIGKTAKISAEPTAEPNGIQIIVPVKSNDISTFQRKVVNTVKHFKVKPVITGMEAPTYDDKKAIIKGEDWEFFGSGAPTVLMGEIAYPVDYYKMGNNLENWESQLLQSDIHIHVNIGDVQVTASREALQMSEKTIETVRKSLAKIKDAMLEETQKAFAEAKNLIEAKTLWYKLINQGGGYSHIIKSHGKIEWQGEEITDRFIELDRNLHEVLIYHTKGRTQIDSYHGYNIDCNGETFYFDDTDQKAIGYKRRARTLLNNGAKEVRIIQTTDKQALEDVLGMSVTEFESFKAVEETKALSNRAGGTGTDLSKRAKHTSKVFVLNVDKLLRNDYSASSEIWDVKEVENMKGVYIPIERFKPIDMQKVYNLDRLATILRAMQQADMPINIPIYGIKKGMSTKGLGRFDKWVEGKVKTNTPLHKDYSRALASSNYDLFDASYLNEEKLPEDSVAKTYTIAYKALKKFGGTNDPKYKILNYFPVQVDADTTVKELSKKFEKQYPMLEFISCYNYDKPIIVEYIRERESKGEVAMAASA